MIRRSLPALAAAWVLTLAFAAPARAQFTDDPTLVDKVVAIVGDSVILASQVEEQFQQLKAQNPDAVPTDSDALAAFKRRILDDLVDRQLILRAALKDTLVRADEDRVKEVVDQEIQATQNRFGSQTAMLQALQGEGLTLAQYREIRATQVREQQLQQLYVQQQIQTAPPIEISEDELRQAFQDASANLSETQRPRLLSIKQVVLVPEPSDSAKAAAKAKAQAILDSIRAGADFATMAERYSMDPGSASNGGDLDWFRRGQMVRPFEEAAFALRDGEVSDVVETEFGYHIIKVERSRAGERKGRHILIIPQLSTQDIERARTRADSVAELARAGTSMDTLYNEYSDPLAPDTLTLSFDQLSSLPPSYSTLQSAQQGDIVGPLEYETARGETRFAVVKVRQIREAGAYTFDDVKGQLAQQLQRSKQVERILADLRAKTHVEILM
ncbi:MAG: peptidylprolyl isomerase [Gemmatimonadota bacterium]|jgi:peptidyl-prolyl cis-trans isomerase SurA